MIEAFKVAKNILKAHRDDTEEALKNNIIRMLSLVLKLNNFDSNANITIKFKVLTWELELLPPLIS